MKTQKKIVQSYYVVMDHDLKITYKNLKEIKRKVQQRVDLKVFNCFLEINKPSLDEFLSKILRNIIIFLYFLF